MYAGEKISALYNIACCHSQLGDTRNGLVALAGSLEAGFDDFNTARTDPDLAPLRYAANRSSPKTSWTYKLQGWPSGEQASNSFAL